MVDVTCKHCHHSFGFCDQGQEVRCNYCLRVYERSGLDNLLQELDAFEDQYEVHEALEKSLGQVINRLLALKELCERGRFDYPKLKAFLIEGKALPQVDYERLGKILGVGKHDAAG